MTQLSSFPLDGGPWTRPITFYLLIYFMLAPTPTIGDQMTTILSMRVKTPPQIGHVQYIVIYGHQITLF